MRQLDGITEDQIKQVMEVDARLLNLTLEEYQSELEKLNKPSSTGKREQDKATRDQLITETQDLLSIVNLALSARRGEVTLSPKQKQAVFDRLGEYGETLTTHLKTAFAPVGGMSMFWNPKAQNPESGDGLAVYVGGWSDGSKNLRYQYAPRKCPISKRSGYRDDSFDVPVYKLPDPGKSKTKDQDSQSNKDQD